MDNKICVSSGSKVGRLQSKVLKKIYYPLPNNVIDKDELLIKPDINISHIIRFNGPLFTSIINRNKGIIYPVRVYRSRINFFSEKICHLMTTFFKNGVILHISIDKMISNPETIKRIKKSGYATYWYICPNDLKKGQKNFIHRIRYDVS